MPRSHLLVIASGLFLLSSAIPATSQSISGVPAWFVRTDDSPHAVACEPFHKLVLATVPNRNRLEVFSSETGAHLASIPIPNPTGVDVSADGMTIFVGTKTETFYIVDASSLAVRQRALGPPGLLNFDLVAMNNGIVLAVSTEGNTTGTKLLRWNPQDNTFQVLGPQQLGVFAPDEVARSHDHSKAIVTSPFVGPSLALYDAATDSFLVQNGVRGLEPAANHNGTRFAVLTSDGLVVLDDQLHIVFQSSPTDFGLAFTRALLYNASGQLLYVAQAAGNNPYFYRALETQSYSEVGRVPSVTTQEPITSSARLATDGTGWIIHVGQRGVAFVDASNPRSLPATGTIARFPDALIPPQGSPASPTPTTFNGAGFQPTADVFFGITPGLNPSVQDTNVINVTAPPSVVSGPVPVTAVFSNGWFATAPDGFTYGPQILYLRTSGGSANGGATIEILGYGFDFPLGQIEVRINGVLAPVLDVTFIGKGISFFPFPLQRIRAQTPPGLPGLADVTVITPAGSTTLPRAFHYLQQAQVFPGGSFAQVIYDPMRQRAYLSDIDSVRVFSITANQYLAPLFPPPSPQQAVLEGLALTPDGSRLVVLDSGRHAVHIMDPTGLLSPLSVSVQPCVPLRVATTSTDKAFVQITGVNCNLGALLELDLTTLQFKTRDDPGLGLSDRFFLSSTADGSKVFVAVGNLDPGPIYLWDAVADKFSQAPVSTGLQDDAAAAADGNVFVVDFDIYNPELRYIIQDRDMDLLLGFVRVFGEKLHPSGSLLYMPVQSGIQIFDVQHGTLRQHIVLPQALAATLDALAIDEHGKKVFAISQAGLMVLELASVPLSIGSIQPNIGFQFGGANITVRGSGFASGAQVSFSGVPATTAFIDESTLLVTTPPMPNGGPVRVTVTHPNGEMYSLDAGFIYELGNSVPFITSLFPTVIPAGSSSFTLTVNGSGFLNGVSVVRVNGVDRTTTFVSGTQLTALIPDPDIATPGTRQITVFNPPPGGGSSNARTLTVSLRNPLPTVTGLSPTGATGGGSGVLLNVFGSNFVFNSTVQWDGIPQSTSFVGSTELQAVIPATDLEVADVGTHQVTVVSPGPGGGTSNTANFNVLNAANPAPTLASLMPNNETAGAIRTSLPVMVNGTNFAPDSIVRWNGMNRLTSFIDASHLTATIPASDLAAAGTAQVTVFTPAPGGGTSTALPFTINNPAPTLTSISPNSATEGGPAFTLTALGSNFLPGSVVRWNGSPRPTTFIGSNQLRAAIPATDLASVTPVNVTVFNPAPGGGASAPQSFTINSPAQASVSTTQAARHPEQTASPEPQRVPAITAPLAPSVPVSVPVINSFQPAFVVAGSGTLKLRVRGENFTEESVVRLKGKDLPTKFISESELEVELPVSALAQPGELKLTVFTPGPSGGASKPATLTVAPQP